MPYCREGHTLFDLEAEGGWERFVPGTNFTLVVNAVTYYGIVDEYVEPTADTLVCRLYSDPARTILVTTPVPTGLAYEITEFVDYLHDAKDIELQSDSGMGIWRSPPVIIRDDTGVWGGEWVASPRRNGEVQFNFDGTHINFKAIAADPLISEQAGAGLGAGTYNYCIVPVDASAREGAGSRKLVITLAGPADILIDWLPDSRVDSWNVYGRVNGTIGFLVNLPGSTVSWLDDGTAVPNTAQKPPLFEDPNWTPVQANLEVDGTDGDVTFASEGVEEGTVKLDDGTSLSDFTADGDVAIINNAESLSFLLNNLTSHVSTKQDVIVDPNLFTNDTGPVSSLPPKVITYDYHVFINTDGDTVISETDSGSGQTTTIVVNLADNTFDITLSDSSGILATDSVPISPNFTIPDPGSISAQTTYSNFREQPDGTILADEKLEVNTYTVTPQTNPGIMFFTSGNFFPAFNLQAAYSTDSGLNWNTFGVTSRLILPAGGFSVDVNRRPEACVGHGKGWTVIASKPAGNDMAMHWTNDLTANPWPFNDSQGRVAGGDPAAAGTSFWGASDATVGSNHNRVAHWPIVTFANGLGPVMLKQCPTEDTQVFNNWFHFFFPATGVMTHVQANSLAPPSTDLGPYIFWPEKNMLLGMPRFGAQDQVYKYDIVNNEAAPINTGSGALVHTVPVTIIRDHWMFCTANIAGIIYREVIDDSWHFSWTLNGTTWNDQNLGIFPRLGGNVIVANNYPASHPLAIYPGFLSDPTRDGRIIYHQNTRDIYESLDNGQTFNLITPTGNAIGDFDAKDWSLHNPVGTIAVSGLNVPMGMPFFWDGIVLGSFGPDDASQTFFANSFHRMDDSYVAQSPKHGNAVNIGQRQELVRLGTTVGSLGSPNGTPAANLRRYLGRSAVIPTGVAATPKPFVIRSGASPVYDSKRTQDYPALGGSIRVTITEGAAGIGQASLTNYENGQYITENVPNSSDAIAAARKPKQTNTRWTEHPWGTFE